MSDKILESVFLDQSLWTETMEWGVRKGIPHYALEYIQDPHCRAELCEKIALGEYEINLPRTMYIRKDDGGERTVFVNDPITRLLFHVVYLWLMRNESSMIHPSCQSYHEGIGIGKIVGRVSRDIHSLSLGCDDGIVGRKFDIHHYFESVPRRLIHETLDKVECHYGKSSVVSLIRCYFDSDTYYDSRKGELVEAYQGIKQGCAVSSWFANVLLFSLDKELSAFDECYVRYSDDILYVGRHYEQATEIIRRHLQTSGLQLNDKKTENVRPDRFVRFLGFDIRDEEITLSGKWVKNFQKNIDRLTIRNKRLIRQVRKLRSQKTPTSEQRLLRLLESATRNVVRFLYFGDGQHSWASLVLPILNRQEDINQLNEYCIDALRAVFTGKTNIGGLGKSVKGDIIRGKGRNVAANRLATDKWLKHYCSLSAMKKVVGNKWLFRALVHNMLLVDSKRTVVRPVSDNIDTLDMGELEDAYSRFLMSRPDGAAISQFYAKPIAELTLEDMLKADSRKDARLNLVSSLGRFPSFSAISGDSSRWFWQSRVHPELVLLSEWFE